MEQKFREILAFNIKMERIRHKFTQDVLAEKINISTKHLTKIESGCVTPSIYLVYKLAKELNVTLNDLVTEYKR